MLTIIKLCMQTDYLYIFYFYEITGINKRFKQVLKPHDLRVP